MKRRHYKKARTTKTRAKNEKAKIGASLTSENGWVLGSRSRNGRRVSTNHGVNPRRRGEQREKPRGERWTDLGVLPILRANGGACETRMVGRKQEQAAKEKNGYVVSVCGSCERRNGEMVRRDEGSRMEIDKEMVRASKGFRAVARQCGKIRSCYQRARFII